MERVNKIINHKIYKQEMEKIKYFERERIYCKHGLEHQLEVARMAYILTLEEQSGIDKELIYATALLHDIGRGVQYETKESHEKISVLLAEKILPECGFSENEMRDILYAIESHREKDKNVLNGLAKVIYEADKKSRNCFSCESAHTCYWSTDKKNKKLEL